MKNANLSGTILEGADLRGVLNLTNQQISKAVINGETILPDKIEEET